MFNKEKKVVRKYLKSRTAPPGVAWRNAQAPRPSRVYGGSLQMYRQSAKVDTRLDIIQERRILFIYWDRRFTIRFDTIFQKNTNLR